MLVLIQQTGIRSCLVYQFYQLHQLMIMLMMMIIYHLKINYDDDVVCGAGLQSTSPRKYLPQLHF